VTMDGRAITIARPEGVAQSIERNAAETVGNALSRQAIERRQPLITPRTARGPEAAAPSRSVSSEREIGSRAVQPSTRQSLPQIRQPAARSQPSSTLQPPASRSAISAPARVTGSKPTAERHRIDAPQLKSGHTGETSRIGGTASRSTPVTVQRRQASSGGPGVVQSSTRRQVVSRQSPVLSRAPAASNSQKSAATQQRVPASRSSAASVNRSAPARGNNASSKQRANEPSRKRRD
jgi:hypothetical protein